MISDIDERLDQIITRINASLDNKSMRKVPFEKLIFTDEEEAAWVKKEPDFTKRIVTPLKNKRRGTVTLRNNVYIDLLLEVTDLLVRGELEDVF